MAREELQMFLAILLCSCISLVAAAYETNASVVPGKLNVHLVAHTHDDVGWLKTVDQYYIGANNSIQEAGVQYIISSVVASLQQNPDRKFIYVEQAFFQRWWKEQTPSTQNIVKDLVARGQLEFINGGWCMHDEATTHYMDMIDQTTLGHRFIKQQFGKVPRIGWQIDPFGHSAVQAYLLGAELGFDGLFFGRIDYQDRAQRLEDKSLEVVWRSSKSLSSDSQIFASVFPVGYGAPDGFAYEEDNEIPVQDDPDLFDFNVKERVEDFVNAAMSQAEVTRTNHVMWTMGTDFKYESANRWFVQMDKLIHYVNKDGRVNALYSTPSIYLDALNAANTSWPLKTGDFFPYADDSQSFWTGYFSSRLALKRYVRISSGYLQAARQLEVLAGRRDEGPNTDTLWAALSVAQHHDAVSGTEKQHVADDYAKRLALGATDASAVIKSAIGHLRNMSTSELLECPLLNISYCPSSESLEEGKTLVVTAYNSLAWSRQEYMRLPVNIDGILVKDGFGKTLSSQLVPLSNHTKKLRDVYVRANFGIVPEDAPVYWLYFRATVPPLTFSTFYIKASNEPGGAAMSRLEEHSISSTEAEIGFSTKVGFSSGTGEMSFIRSNATAMAALPVKQSYKWYAGYNGGQYVQNSGAYIFLPNGSSSYPVGQAVSLTIYRGPLVEEAQQSFAPWVYQASRTFRGEDDVDVEFIVGPVPAADRVGKEVITSFETAVQSDKVFYTDSNGRDFLKRVRDFRPDWNLSVTQPIAGNYYPVNLAMSIRDNNTDFSVLVDRAMGGASIYDGEVQLMLHRRLLADDSRGVGEPLDEIVCLPTKCEGLTIQGVLHIGVNTLDKAARWRRSKGQRVLSPLHLMFNMQDDSYTNENPVQTTFDDYQLPENVALITLQALDNKHVLVRLAHLYEVDEDKELSKPARVELRKLFGKRAITKATELSLSANQERSSMKSQLKWSIIGQAANATSSGVRGAPVDAAALVVELFPMEIRTFELEL